MDFDAYRNPDGKTFNGVALLADLSGLSREEIAWTAARLKQLMVFEGKPKAEALATVATEARSRPWES